MKILYLAGFALLTGLAAVNTAATGTAPQYIAPIEISGNTDSLGLALLHSQCFTCHDPDLETENRAAPPMFRIQGHYLQGNISLKRFATQLLNFVLSPSEKEARMGCAVNNFGLMPTLPFRKEDVTTIAAYLYTHDLASEEWDKEYAAYLESLKNLQPTIQSDFKEQSRSAMITAKTALSMKLTGAIAQRGTAGAIDFCSMNALAIMDSMSKLLDVSVSRVSDQPRNPMNTASTQEKTFILQMKTDLAKGNQPQPVFANTPDGKQVAYYPIITNEMCLQCHGKPGTDISDESLKVLKIKYPLDTATGYTKDQIRGLFKVVANH